jgi:hypothetical protein
MTSSTIIVVFCTWGYVPAVLYIRKPAVQDRGEGDRKPEKPGRHSSEGGEVASRPYR